MPKYNTMFARLTLALLLFVGCGDSDESSLFGSNVDSEANQRLKKQAPEVEGIYSIDSLTRNENGCDVDGSSILDELGEQTNMVAVLSETLGVNQLDLYSCSDSADCRDIADKLKNPSFGTGFGFSIHFSFAQADDADHFSGGMVFTGHDSGDSGVCTDGRIEEHSLERNGDVLQIENRVTLSKDYPSEDGVCWTDDSEEAAKGEPCAQLEVAKLTLIEPL